MAKYWVFISYANEDADFARRIKTKLERLRIGVKLRGFCKTPPGVETRQRVFLDKDDIVKDGKDLPDVIRQEIAQAEKLVVLCSPHAASTSSHVNLEVQEFIRLGRVDHIHPVIVSGRPSDVLGPQDCFPAPLRQKYDAEGAIVGPNNPLCPDFRNDAYFRNEAEWANLLSGILGVERDVLYSAMRRQVRRRRLVTVAATVSAIAVVAASYWHFERLALKERLAQRAAAINYARTLATTDLVEAAKVVLSVWPTSEEELPANADEGLQVLSDMAVDSKVVTVFEEYGTSVSALAISPDGSAIITGDESGMLRVWNARTGAQLTVFDKHQASISSITISSNGTNVLTGAEDGTVRLWDIRKGTELRVFEDPDGRIATGRFSSDGWRAIITIGGSERIWDLKSGKELWESPQESIFSPDGRMALTGKNNGEIDVWQIATGDRLARFKVPGAFISTAAFSADGSRVIVFANDSSGHILDIAANAVAGVIPDVDADSAKAYFPEKGPNVLIIGAENLEAPKFMAVWDAVEAQELWKEESDEIEKGVRTAAITADGSRVLMLAQNGTMLIRDADTGEQAETFSEPSGEIEQVAMSLDGRILLTSSNDGKVRLMRSDESLVVKRIALADGVPGSVFMSPDGSRVVGSFHDGARVFDATSGDELTRFPHDDRVFSAAFSRDAKTVLTAAPDDTVRLWSVAGAKPIITFPDSGDITNAVFSADERYILAGMPDGNIRLWDVENSASFRTIKLAEGISTARFSHDGKWIVTAGKTPAIWDSATGTPLKTLEPYAQPPQDAMFSPDDSMILLGSGHLIDAATGHLVRDFSETEADVAVDFDVSFLRNGQSVLTAAMSYATIWDVETGKRMIEFSGYGEYESFHAASASADGLRVVTASEDPPRLTVWNAGSLRDVSNLLQYACNRLPSRNGQPDTVLTGVTPGFADVVGMISPCKDYVGAVLPRGQ